MLNCKKCGSVIIFDNSFVCSSCGYDFNYPEGQKSYIKELYNYYIQNSSLQEGRTAFIEGALLENNPHSDVLKLNFWIEGWNSEKNIQDQFFKIMDLNQKIIDLSKENRELKEHILSQVKEIDKRENFINSFIILIRSIHDDFSSFYGKIFRFGQNRRVDSLVKILKEFLDKKYR